MGVESGHPRQAEILDQLSLFQFLQGKLPEAEMHARRSLAVIQNHFEAGDPAVCMCELRLGAILFSEFPAPPLPCPPTPPSQSFPSSQLTYGVEAWLMVQPSSTNARQLQHLQVIDKVYYVIR